MINLIGNFSERCIICYLINGKYFFYIYGIIDKKVVFV